MKKIILMAVAMLSMTTATFAGNEENAATETAAAYALNINVKSLAETLDLTVDQAEAMKDVQTTFAAEMMNAGQASDADRQALANKAINKDLKYMKVILSKSQYRKYLMLLNTTLVNRGIQK